MKVKRLTTVFIAAVLTIIIVCSICSVLLIKGVEVDYRVAESGQAYTEEIQNKLDKFINKSIVTFKKSKVNAVLQDYPYIEVLSVAKKYPDRIIVSVRERQEIYRVNYAEDEYAILDESGFVLAKNFSYGKKFIEIEGVNFLSLNVGTYAECSSELEKTLLDGIYKMSKIASFTDNVEKVEIVCGVELTDVIYRMRTGVSIVIDKANIDGAEKMGQAFAVFNGEAASKNPDSGESKIISDYEKSGGYILAYKRDDGELIAMHTADIGDRYEYLKAAVKI